MAESPCARKVHRAGHGLEGLYPADQLLHMRIEILHAEAHARDATGREGLDKFLVDIARVKLDRDFGVGREGEAATQGVGQREQPRGPEHQGVPPPQWAWITLRAGVAEATRSISRKRVSA